MKEFFKSKLGDALYSNLRDTRDFIIRAPKIPEAYLHAWRRDTINRLPALRDSHKGERCFIIGNGPSLNQTDLHKLKNEYTFGLNRIFMMFPQLGFETSYLVSINDLVIEQSAAEIQELVIPKFIAWRSHRWLRPSKNQYFLYTTYTEPTFAIDLTRRVWEGATVTYVALQIAFYLGFKEAILIGVDHNFVSKGKPNTTIVSEGDDPNHFHPGYFGKGFRWQLPDLETSEIAYRMAREMYEKHGRKVIDATVGGKLTIFPKADYNKLF